MIGGRECETSMQDVKSLECIKGPKVRSFEIFNN